MSTVCVPHFTRYLLHLKHGLARLLQLLLQLLSPILLPQRLPQFSHALVLVLLCQYGYANANSDLKSASTIISSANASSANSLGIAVIFPDIAEPYRTIFTRIIEGMEDKLQSRIPSIAISKNFNINELQDNLRRQNIKVVIALGRQGLNVARLLSKEFSVIVGGVLVSSEAEARGIAIHSLTPDPALLFVRLKNLMPSVKRVVVVYDPKQNDWLIKHAKVAARAIGLELVAYEAQDLKAAMARYQDFLSNADPAKEALWLPHDSTSVQESSVIPLVLRGAWNRSLVVFSSSLAHVEKGILFSLYPDNLDMGRGLAAAARARLNNPSANQIQPLRELMAAINTSTASHLGISMSNRRQNFDMIFPEQ